MTETLDTHGFTVKVYPLKTCWRWELYEGGELRHKGLSGFKVGALYAGKCAAIGMKRKRDAEKRKAARS